MENIIYNLALVFVVNVASLTLAVAYGSPLRRNTYKCLLKTEENYEKKIGEKPKRPWPYTNHFMLHLFNGKAEEFEKGLRNQIEFN